jgi:hypothetical protein
MLGKERKFMKMKLEKNSILFLIVLSLIIISGCFFFPKRSDYTKIQVYSRDPSSPPTTTVKAMEDLFVSVEGLAPLERCNIQIVNSKKMVIAEYTLNATEEGRIPTALMCPLIGVAPDSLDPTNLILGSYKVILTGLNVSFSFEVVSDDKYDKPDQPIIWSLDSGGRVSNGYRENTGNVWVAGINFPPNETVNIYIMPDQEFWGMGDSLSVGTLSASIDTSNEGKLGPVDLGVVGSCGNYDIIVDVYPNGFFDEKDAIDGRYNAGYSAQSDPATCFEYLHMELASNGKLFQDDFSYDGSDTGLLWGGPDRGVFCIFNPKLDDRQTTGLVPWSKVQVWIITLLDFEKLSGSTVNNDLTGKDVSNKDGKPDVITIDRTCGNEADPILIWPAPLMIRNESVTWDYNFVVIIEKPDPLTGQFENKYHPLTDYMDGALTTDTLSTRGFGVIGAPTPTPTRRI